MKEQIEEMAKEICLATQKTNYSCKSMCKKQGSCAYCIVMAESLYNAGYRKQKEGEWIGQADGYADGELVYDVWYCSECNHCIDDGTDDAGLLPNYCPNCGAHMRGGAE